MTVRILIGDVFDRLAGLDAESVHCCVVSPPYWGLRDYGVEGQIGLEPTMGEHLDVMVRVMREVRRVLRPDGTVWLNYGDCYATQPNGRSAADTNDLSPDDRTFRDKPFSTVGAVLGSSDADAKRSQNGYEAYRPSHGNRVVAGGYLKPKDLCMVPQRLAIALQDDGWWVRSEIIWHKPNPMPESVSDRPVSANEKVYLLTKSERYFYDAEAVREKTDEKPTLNAENPGGQKYSFKRANSKRAEAHPGQSEGTHRADREDIDYCGTRHPRNVWTIATRPFRVEMCTICRYVYLNEQLGLIRVETYKDDKGVERKRKFCTCGAHDAWLSHFATFPPALVEPCIRAGTSEYGVCSECGAPYERIVEKVHEDGGAVQSGQASALKFGATPEKGGTYKRLITRTVGWRATCACGEHTQVGAPVPATVLDPFGGAGTVGLVARALQRRAVLIELNPNYAAIARKRIHEAEPLFNPVSVFSYRGEAAE